MNGNNAPSYRFRQFLLDVAERQLFQSEKLIPLTPKAFDVLVFLVENHGHLVLKDELMQAVWPDSFVDEVNLPRTIHTLRRVLGEDENENKFIETVPTKGYRFVADLEVVRKDARKSRNRSQNSAVVAERPAETDIQIPLPVINKNAIPLVSKPENSARIILVAVGVLSVISLISLVAFDRQSATTVNSNETKSIAVLPVMPVNTNDPDLIYELGLADSLINKLSLAKGWKVRPLSTTRKYSGIGQDAMAAGREQEVDYVLASTYKIFDGKIRVTSQFINVQSGSAEELYESEKEISNLIQMEDAVANEIGNRLLMRFGSTGNNLTVDRETTNVEAYRLYLKAEYIFEEWNEPEIGKAINNLEQAVKLDPKYTSAYVQLAYAYQSYQFVWSKNIPSEHEYYIRSKDAIEKALTLNENSADAHAVLGLIKGGYERDLAGAEKEYNRAIELDPDSGMARGLYAHYLMDAGRFDEALAEERKAIELEPTFVVDRIAYGIILFNARRYKEATAHFLEMREKDENLYNPYMLLWILADVQGDEPDAYEWFMKYQTQVKSDPVTIRLYQTAYQRSGWKGILREVIRKGEKTLKVNNDPDVLFEIACFNAKLGNKDKAFEYLYRAYSVRRSSLNGIKVDPNIDSLRSDPRFRALLPRIGLSLQ